MKIKFVLLVLALPIIGFCKTELELQAEKELEKGFENTALGIVYTSVGVIFATTGNPVATVVGIGRGVDKIRDGVEHLKEAKHLFDEAREMDRDREGNSCNDCDNRNDSRDY